MVAQKAVCLRRCLMASETRRVQRVFLFTAAAAHKPPAAHATHHNTKQSRFPVFLTWRAWLWMPCRWVPTAPRLTTASILNPCVSADIWWSQYSLLPYWDILWFESAPSCKKFGKHCHCAVQVRCSVGRKRFPFGMDCYSELWTTTHYHTRWETIVSQQPCYINPCMTHMQTYSWEETKT